MYVFFFTMLSSALFSKGQEIANDPQKLFSLLGESVPGAGNFFIAYVALKAFSEFPSELVRIGPLIMSSLMYGRAKTDAERMEILEPGTFDYSKYGTFTHMPKAVTFHEPTVM